MLANREVEIQKSLLFRDLPGGSVQRSSQVEFTPTEERGRFEIIVQGVTLAAVWCPSHGLYCSPSLGTSALVSRGAVQVEPGALRCCKQKSGLCCSPCITCRTRSCRALFTLGLSDGTNHGLDDELAQPLRDTSLQELWGPVTADSPLLPEQEEIGMTHSRTPQKDTSSEPLWRYLRQCSSIQQEMGEGGAKKNLLFPGCSGYGTRAIFAFPVIPHRALHSRYQVLVPL